MVSDPSPGHPPRLFLLNIADAGALRHYYLEWIDSGGIFIPTPLNSNLGEKVFLILSLAGERHAVEAKVVWVNSCKSLGDRPGGIGVQFLETDTSLQKIVEKALGKVPVPGIEAPGPTF